MFQHILFVHICYFGLIFHISINVCVYLKLLKENYDFFPLDRALSLAGMGKDSTETKIDDLLYHVTSIVDKQRREVW